MKKSVIFVVSAIIALAMFCGCASPAYTNLYPNCGTITEVNYDTDTVYCEDSCGTVWSWSGCEDWMVGDHCSMILDSNGTALTADDTVVSARYEG